MLVRLHEETTELWLGLKITAASWLILWLLLAARWVRLVCDSATTSFTVYLLQAILRTASERTSVRIVQLLAVATPIVFNAVMREGDILPGQRSLS